jgi:hypothetical protein
MSNFSDNPFQTKVESGYSAFSRKGHAIDTIAGHFGCGESELNCAINTATDYRIQIVSPGNPLVPTNLEYRNNWEIVSVKGIDEMADIELSTEKSKYRDGLRIKGSRREAREIQIVLKVCPCEGCDFLEQRRELYQMVDCAMCQQKDCEHCCKTGQICFDDFMMKDLRYCHLRISCCGVVRQIPVVRKGTIGVATKGICIYYTINYLAPDPYYHFPRVQTQEVTIDPATDLICPPILQGDVNMARVNSFSKCITIPYTGTIDGYARFTIRGPVQNLQITRPDTGVTIDLNNRVDFYDIDGCGAHVLNFWRGQQSYTDGNQQNIYSDLSGGCNNQFVLPANCTNGVEVCISGDLVDPDTFFMKIQWWLEYDGFFALETEPELTPVEIADCGGCIRQEVLTVLESETTCPEKLESDSGFVDLSMVNEFTKCITLVQADQFRNQITFPRIVVRGHADFLVISRPETGQVWDFTTQDVIDELTVYRDCAIRMLDFTHLAIGTESCDAGDFPANAVWFTGTAEYCVSGKNIDPDNFSVTFIYECDPEMAPTC